MNLRHPRLDGDELGAARKLVGWAVAGTALLLAAGAFGTESAPDLSPAMTQVCADISAQAASPQQMDAWVRAEPARTLVGACAQPPNAADALRAAEALRELSRPQPAQRIVQALAAAALAPGDAAKLWRGHWQLLRGFEAYEAGQREPAARHFEAALLAFDAADTAPTRRRARALVGLGLAHRAAGRLDAAERAAEQAQAVLDGLGLAVSLEATDVINLRTVLAHSRQDLAGAVGWARAEIRLMQQLGRGDDAELLHAWASLGGTLSQMGQLLEARDAYQQGLRLIDLHPDSAAYGQLGVLQNLAQTELGVGRPDLALPLAERALALAERHYGADHPRRLRPLMMLAGSHLVAARYGRAIVVFEQAYALAERHRSLLPAHTLLELTDVLASARLQLGQVEQAAALLRAALLVVQGQAGQSYWHGRLLRRLAMVDARRQDWAAAQQHARESAQLLASVLGPEHLMVLDLSSEGCAAQVRSQEHSQEHSQNRAAGSTACDELESQLPRLAAATPAARYRAHAALALREQGRGDNGAALHQLLTAWAAAQADASADPLWLAHDALAVHMRGQGQRWLAVYFAKQAVVALEVLRSEIAGAAAQAERSFLADKLAVYRRLADWLAEDGRLDEAVSAVRLLKEEEFFDFVQRDGALAAGRQRLALSAVEVNLQRRWQALRAGASTWLAEADFVPRAQVLIEALVREGRPAGAANHSPAWPTERRVPEGELRVHALVVDDHVRLLLDGPRGRSTQRLAWPRATAGRDVGALLASIGPGPATLAALQRLHTLLGAPLARAAGAHGAKRLVLRLDGALRYLPVAALHDGHRYLGQRFAIEYRVDAGPGRPQQTRLPPTVQALGISHAVAEQPALPGVALEVCAIVDGPVYGLGAQVCQAAAGRGAVAGVGWMNALFTALRLQAVLAGVPTQVTAPANTAPPEAAATRWLHVGTHFDLRPGRIEDSSLLLGDGSRLRLSELALMRFDGQALVTLSACESGLGGAQGADGREVEGLNLVILRRGAGAVLASLWRVEDASTGFLMAAFYRALRQHSPAQALRQAQAAVRSAHGGRWAAPYHWAGFYVTGRER